MGLFTLLVAGRLWDVERLDPQSRNLLFFFHLMTGGFK